MNDNSDESEYVLDNEHDLDEPDTRTRSSKARAPSAKHAHVKREVSREASVASEQSSKVARVKDSSIAKPKNATLRAYRDLLNSEIAEASGQVSHVKADALPPSQIGACFWTSQEKDKFFEALSCRGSGDLPCLSAAIGTKSQFEVKAYILLLEEGVRELDVAGRAREKFELADAPVAAEISEECLEVEESIAKELDRRVQEREEAKEQERWGEEDWLIDEDVAAAIATEFEIGNEKAIKTEDNEDDGPIDTETPRSRSNDEENDSNSTSLSSDQLLNASNFLQLSRCLFMNSKDPDLDWRTVAEDDDTNPSPSMRRTAFEDFYNLAISLTRRLVQASIFQALSRLRSSSDPRLVAGVNRHDVYVAREIAGPKTEGQEYWANAVRRCGIEVYRESRRFKANDGRKGTKVGYRLTRDELEEALGVKSREKGADASVRADASDTDDDYGADEPDSDAHTIASSSDDGDNDQSDEEREEETISRGRTKSPSENRKRPLSPPSFDRTERKYLEALDQINSTQEENGLRSAFGLEGLPKSRSSKPTFHYKRSIAETRPMDWRETVQYEAPWEQPQGYPRRSDFERMGVKGERRRKRRRLEPESEVVSDRRTESTEDSGDEESQQRSDDEAHQGDEADAVAGAEDDHDEEDEDRDEGEDESGDEEKQSKPGSVGNTLEEGEDSA